ncbi:sec1 family domain-containing protein 2 [Diachasma alloeum]|uniref:sec1 family domain-containing protein 2 n=1 Tax=Diachasma alloeum TaxID=454923 RepID=UPI00073827EC|nr:sec1 family domain-containing protein 2 [Diachasma alloeum]
MDAYGKGMENAYDIFEFSHACWEDVFEKIPGAAVYIDHAAAECLHWFKGDRAYLGLIEAGAHSVHEIAIFTFQYVKVQNTKKAVIIITSSDPAFYERTLHTIIEKNTFENCVIVCAVHSTVFNCDGEEHYEKLREQVSGWMKESAPLAGISVEILFRPIVTAPITKNVFVTPPMERLMPSIDGKITDEHESSVNYFVSSLHSIFTHFDIKEDIYTLGEFSEYVAGRLLDLPAAVARRKMLIGQSGVSLILIDRTLDLCTATKNNTECVLSRILCTLPRLTYHNNDVAVNMAPLCPGSEESPRSMTVSGCLATSENHNFNLLIAKKQKDVLLTLNKWLIEMLSKELQSPKAKLSTRVSAHSLEKLIHKIRATESPKLLAQYSKKLQIILAVIQSLKSEKTAQLDLLISLEKLILQNLAVSRESTSVLSQISNIIKNRTSRGLDMENLLVLLIHIYAMAGTEIHFPPQQEDQLRAALTEAIFEDIQRCNDAVITHEVSVYQQTLLLLGATDEGTAREFARKITEQIVDMLHLIASQRRELQEYGSIIMKPSPQEMAQCVGVVERILRDLIHPSKPVIADLKMKTSSFISAGFNLLTKGRVQHHPTDNPWIIIYVLGGVTAEEARIVEELSSQNANIPRITLAGCRLLTPMDTADRILLSNFNI